MGEGGGSSGACSLRAPGRQKHGVRTPPSWVASILKGSFSKSVSTRRPAVPGFAARVPYIVGRAFTPAGEEVAAMGTGWALCRALPRSTRRCRKAPRRARSPALHCGRKRAAIRKRQPASTPDGGLRRGRVAAGRMRRPGRALPPCFAGCVAAGRVRRPGRVFARPGAAPLRRLRRHLPLQGRLPGRQPHRKAPLQGELDAPEGAD